MNIRIQTALIVAMLIVAASAQASAKQHSQSIVVESPMDLTELAQRPSEGMFLYSTGSGQTFLYLEQDLGKSLSILDVTNPASIKEVGRSSLGASSAYDFVQSLSGSVVLIRYRDHSGFAIVNFKQYRQPVLTPTPELPGQTAIQFVGQDTLLLTSSNDFHVFDQDKQYVVIDISDPLKPTSVVMVRGVKQQLDRRETGTTFLLSQDGLTVIRRPSVEEDYQSESNPAN